MADDILCKLIRGAKSLGTLNELKSQLAVAVGEGLKPLINNGNYCSHLHSIPPSFIFWQRIIDKNWFVKQPRNILMDQITSWEFVLRYSKLVLHHQDFCIMVVQQKPPSLILMRFWSLFQNCEQRANNLKAKNFNNWITFLKACDLWCLTFCIGNLFLLLRLTFLRKYYGFLTKILLRKTNLRETYFIKLMK